LGPVLIGYCVQSRGKKMLDREWARQTGDLSHAGTRVTSFEDSPDGLREEEAAFRTEMVPRVLHIDCCRGEISLVGSAVPRGARSDVPENSLLGSAVPRLRTGVSSVMPTRTSSSRRRCSPDANLIEVVMDVAQGQLTEVTEIARPAARCTRELIHQAKTDRR